jgi:cell division protein ZipA
LQSELRLILLCLSVPLLAGIWWWTARRSSQARGNAELRESSVPLEPRYTEANDEGMRAQPTPREWGVPPFEPLNIRTGDFEHVPVLDGPMMVNLDPVSLSAPPPLAAPMAAMEAPAVAPFSSASTVPTSVPVTPTMPLPVLPESAAEPPPQRAAPEAAASPAAASQGESQKIISIRVCAPADTRWPGAQLMQALEVHGLAFGRYQVFHRKHADGRSLFYLASLVEPGTFDVAAMPEQEFRGVTLFAVLPGPGEPTETIDELLNTAHGLAEQLSGIVQDGKGIALSPQRAAALREEIARFQASLPRK